MRTRPLAEVTLRKYEKPLKIEGRDLVKKLCLSVGLLQPNDSRDVIVDVFCSLLRSKGALSQAEIEATVRAARAKASLPETGCAASNIRRQVRRLRESLFIEKVGAKYKVRDDAPLHHVFEEHFEKFYVPAILLRVKEYCEAVDKERWMNETGSEKR